MATVRPTHLATMGSAHQPVVAQLSSQVTAKWELGVSLILDNWDVLTEAVNNLWGGEDSSGKRDWLAGAIVEMFVGRPETDEDDIEFTLLQVMEDEFSVCLEDDSSWVVARQIIVLRKEIIDGNFSTVDKLHAKFLAKPKNPSASSMLKEVVDPACSSSSEESEDDEEMGDAPPAAPSEPRQLRKPLEPTIDEEGFELVQKRRSRK
ncbi:Pre-rRNA-processing protein TSR2-domain-containing protein [Tuber borchii]|uniref:Pre-rRNA-processing protein TSR2-domain-containing protein n=1 Tax=Tuber borchii TaxID=42251 RepID=A0A2T7A2V0_TUBBO|nr:Pre-rRNA-processing protein TSR2-domain-containing protein [Tuber borchii]